MTESNTIEPNDPEAPFFSATLTPHRSLGRRGFLTMMLIALAVAFWSGMRFYVLGAWPIALFMLADVGLLYLAFKLSYRSGRAFEEVHVSLTEVVVKQVAANGRMREHRFNPAWARLTVTRLADEGVTRLDLSSHGRSLVVGAFLNPDDRESFASAFGNALADARSGRARPA
ncbi:DUF2244 domain-containing protein [Amorphus orientalis]|uniref:Membrane protein n=1 Tax=Amorphus orientalis TaxID=649198 RepID=A0AAE3VRF9_9HYPH|nr:DUF2244 domain-containing protein [Amorphus orientalis]MDQ0316793.1 putative membrane protein [Amorphus orientalis]